MSARVVHIEKKSLDVPHSARQLIRALRGHANRDLTVADAATLSGLPLEQCQDALWHLSAQYPSRVKVNESGELLFCFSSLSKSRLPSGWAQAWRRMQPWLAQRRDTLLALMTVLLGPPFLLSVSGHSMAIIESCGYGGYCAPLYLVMGAFFLGGIVSLLVFQLLPLATVVTVMAGFIMLMYPFEEGVEFPLALFPMGLGLALFYVAFIFGVLCLHVWLEVLAGDRAQWARQLWRDIGGAIFGPPVQVADSLTDERRLTALIDQHDGVLTAADLAALFGWTLEQADSELTRILADYGGDVLVGEEGGVAYRFDPMRVRLNQDATLDDLRPIYARERKPRPFFACPTYMWILLLTAMGVGIVGLAWHPDLALFPTPKQIEEGFEEVFENRKQAIYMQGVGAYLYLAALLPILVRAVWRLVGAVRTSRRQRFWKVLQAMVESPEGSYPGRVSNRDVALLGGTWDITRTNERGEPPLVFPEVIAARRAALAIRDSLPAPDLGRTVYDSGEPG